MGLSESRCESLAREILATRHGLEEMKLSQTKKGGGTNSGRPTKKHQTKKNRLESKLSDLYKGFLPGEKARERADSRHLQDSARQNFRQHTRASAPKGRPRAQTSSGQSALF